MTVATRNYRLLIVDDDDTDQRLYVRLLTSAAVGSCHIEQAARGGAGLAMLRDHSFDCVLLDFNLPDMTGIEFLSEAMQDGELPCAVVLITGQGNEAIAVAAMKRGVQDYLVKDQLSANSLWRAMTQAVTQTELRQRLAGTLRDLTNANAALEQEAAIRAATETALRTAKESAEQASRAKTRFVAMVTHELRTPLNGILGYAQLLRIEGGLSPRQDSRVGAMIRAGQHLLDMIEHVLDFASIEAGHMTLQPVPVVIRELADSCIACIGPMATDHALSLRMVAAHDAPWEIEADPARLRQILLNLLGNAVKYTESGRVELRLLAGATSGGLRIEVADTGPGIADTAGPRLFQDFERLDAARSVEGAGLGLAIAARIVALMGGEIGHAPNPGGGSVFWLELPPPHHVPAAVAVLPAASGRRVLLVDDIAMNRDVIGAFIGAAGHEVRIAASGREAIRIAATEDLDLVLMDVRMPEMDGLEATRHIRALPPPHGQVPILALTAYAFAHQMAECRECGMDGHIAKPIDYPTLIGAIHDTIVRAPLSRPAAPLDSQAGPEAPTPRLRHVLPQDTPIALAIQEGADQQHTLQP